MRLTTYKRDAAELLDVPQTTPVFEMLDMLKERLPVTFDQPQSKLEAARLVQAIGSKFVGRKYEFLN